MAEKPKPNPTTTPDLTHATGDPDETLGAYITGVRTQKSLSRDQVVAQTRIPAHYINMIETDNFTLVADQLYLLPFVRRYAEFLGLDGEDTAMRFVREVQRAEISVQRISDPVTIRPKSPGRLRRIVTILLVLIVLFAIIDLAVRYLIPMSGIHFGSAPPPLRTTTVPLPEAPNPPPPSAGQPAQSSTALSNDLPAAPPN
ncbi:MAG: helix-turn-helix domain-containing protein [Candidatus Binataceae bacterium]